MELLSWKKYVQKLHRNQFWEGLGLHLGRVWDGFGPLLSALGHLLVIFWAIKIELFQTLVQDWAPRGFLDRFWVDVGKDLGSIWGFICSTAPRVLPWLCTEPGAAHPSG